MRHAPFMGRKIQFAIIVAGYRLGHDSEMHTRARAGEEKMPRVEPGESRRIVQQKMRITSQYRDGVGTESRTFHNGVGDLRAVW